MSFSRSGGAGSVAQILVDQQNSSGRESRFAYSIEKNLRAEPFSAPRHTIAAGLDEYLVKKPGFSAPISVLRDEISSRLTADPSQSDIVHLHNINGVLPVEKMGKLWGHKKIIWTLHDMNPFTGACHYSLDCQGFRGNCSNCPAVRTLFTDTVTSALAHKVAAFQEIKDLSIVAPSTWLAELAADSAVFQGREISVIANPCGVEFFPTNPVAEPSHIGHGEAYTFCVVAQNLSDGVKQVNDAVSAFAKIHYKHPQATMALVGGGGEEFAGPGISLAGRLNRSELSTLLSRTRCLISPSRAENAPLVIVEAAARGCRSVVREVGGMPELITRLGAGMTFHDSEELLQHMTHIADEAPSTTTRHRSPLMAAAQAHFSPAVITSQYDELYDY